MIQSVKSTTEININEDELVIFAKNYDLEICTLL